MTAPPQNQKGSPPAFNRDEPNTKGNGQSFAPSAAKVNREASPEMGTPAHDSEAEGSILGCILDRAESVWPLLDKAGVRRRHFFDERWADVFEVLAGMQHEALPPHTPEVLTRLEKLGSNVSGQELAGLLHHSPSIGMEQLYIDRLVDMFIRRTFSDVCKRGQRIADDLEMPLSAVIDLKHHLDSAIEQTTGVPNYENRRFDSARIPPPLRPVFQIGGVPISTPGNITSIASAVKVGKSGFVEAMLASTMASKVSEADTLGIYSENPASRAVVHIDTEQSPDDHWHLVSRAVRRARQGHAPDWLRSYCFTGLEAWAAWAALKDCVKRAANEFGGIHSIFLDGFADFVRDVNDPGECNPLVGELHALAVKFDCPIIGVIHFNPGSEKTRGHLGSQIERKSETNLALEKDKEGVTQVWSTKQRRAPILKGTGPRFTWSDQAGMHVSVESGQSSKDKLTIQEELPTRAEVFSERPAMKHGELKKRVQTVKVVSESTAKRTIEKWVRLKIVECIYGDLYVPKGYQ